MYVLLQYIILSKYALICHLKLFTLICAPIDNNDNTAVEILTWFVNIRIIEGRVSEGDTLIIILTKFVNNLQLKKNEELRKWKTLLRIKNAKKCYNSSEHSLEHAET